VVEIMEYLATIITGAGWLPAKGFERV